MMDSVSCFVSKYLYYPAYVLVPSVVMHKYLQKLIKFFYRLPLYITIMSKLKNIHPGEVLKEEFLKPLGITAYRLSKDMFIPQTRISEILKGKRRVTADSALRFAKYFGTSAKFWLGLQDDYDLEEEGINKKSELDEIPKINTNAA